MRNPVGEAGSTVGVMDRDVHQWEAKAVEPASRQQQLRAAHRTTKATTGLVSE
ncbi:MAG: hypothetical protein ACM3XO_13645 [Bacteroidota bacterium]